MILVGGENQLPLVLRCKSMGYYTIVCDSREEIPCKTLADKHYQINAIDVEGLINCGIREKIDGIITNSEPSFLSMATVAERLNLRCMSQELTALYKDKFLMREFCVKHNILSPQYKRCTDLNEALEFFREVKRKCIIKPLDNSASRGVYSINTEDELINLFEQSKSQSRSDSPAVIIEEYIQGTEFTIDGLKTPHGHFCLAISEKKHYAYNENVAYQLLFENQNNKFDYSKLRAANDFLVDQTGLPFGLTHAEYKYFDGNFYLIEIQARGGGNYIATDIVPFVSGVDSYTEQIKWCMHDDTPIEIDYSKLSDRCSVLFFFDVPGKGGVVKGIKGLDYFDSLGDQMMYHLNFKVGDTIQQTKDDSTRIGWYILKSPNRADLDNKMHLIEKNFKIII